MNSKFFICFGIIIFIFSMTFVSADWPMFHHDIQQTGYIESSAPGKNHTIWNFSAALSHSSPVITDGKVIITSVNDNQVYALSQSNGSRIWNKSIPNLAWNYRVGNITFHFSSTPAVVGGIIYVGTSDCKIYALNLSNGNQIWNFTGNGRTASFLSVANNRVIFRCHDEGNTNDTLYLLDAVSGKSVFEKKLPYFSAKTISPAISAVDNLAYTEIYRCKMSAINLSNGNVIWNFTVTKGCGSVGLSPPMLVNDKLIFGTDMGYVYFVNTKNPLQFNKTYLNATAGGHGEYIASRMVPAVWNDMIFIGTGIRTVNRSDQCKLIRTYGNFYAINLTNYSIIWNFTVGDAIQSAPAVADGKVFFLAQNNVFYALNALNGRVNWTYATPDTGCAAENDIYTSSPAVSDGVVVIGVPERKIYAFKTIQLVFVKVAWNDSSANFTNFTIQSANYFLEKSGLNTCGMQVEIEIVPGSPPDIKGQDICDAWNRNNVSSILRRIKDWALKNNIRGDRYIGLTTRNIMAECEVGGYTTFIPDSHYDTVIAQYNPLSLASHELGHSFGLCDEYTTSAAGVCNWTCQNDRLSQAGLGGCPNNIGCTGDNSCDCGGVSGTTQCIQGVCLESMTESGRPVRFFYYSPQNCGIHLPFYYRAGPRHPPQCIGAGHYTLAKNYCSSPNCPSRCSCTQLGRYKGGIMEVKAYLYDDKGQLIGTFDGYRCAIGQCQNGVFECFGLRFSDDTFSIMGMGNIPHGAYSPASASHLRRVLCENKGFVGLPPLATYNGTSGVAASKYTSKSIDQKDGNYLKVSFVVRNDGTGSFNDIEILKDGEIADVPRGDYSVVLKNNKREVLYTKSFGVSFVVMGEPPKIYNETSITFTIPYVDGAKSIEIRRGNKVLFSTSIPVINNGGFETGDFSGWMAGGPGDHKVDTQTPYAGRYSALIGFRDTPNVVNGYDYIYQTIEVPLNKESELSFYYRFYSHDYCHFDFFTVHIKDENGNVLATPVNRCLHGGGLKDTGWTEVKFNLTPYAGRKIQVYFEVSNRYDALFNSWAYVDNVSVRSVSQWVNGGFETGDLRGWAAGGGGCRPDWVTIVNSSAKPGLVRGGNYAAVGNAPWTGAYSNPGRCVPGWFCPEDAILTKQIKVPAYNIEGGFYLDFYTMIQTGHPWQSQVRVTVRDLTTGEIIYARGNGAFSGYHGLECPPGNCNAGIGHGCTEPNDHWQYHHVPLNGRENRTIELQLRSHNCCWCSLFYVDDVCIADKDGACI